MEGSARPLFGPAGPRVRETQALPELHYRLPLWVSCEAAPRSVSASSSEQSTKRCCGISRKLRLNRTTKTVC